MSSKIGFGDRKKAKFRETCEESNSRRLQVFIFEHPSKVAIRIRKSYSQVQKVLVKMAAIFG